jgi:hypothetical protein
MSTLRRNDGESTDTLRRDLPDLADEVVSGSRTEPALAEALRDYGRVCARLESGKAGPAERTELMEIRTELVSELRRLALRLRERSKRETSDD